MRTGSREAKEFLPYRPGASRRAEGIRTLDPHVANVVLSQLSYCPVSGTGGPRAETPKRSS
jgi:hypothetical protein